jgi:hypothetical protein
MQHYHYDNRRRHVNMPIRLTIKKLDEKHIRINGIIEKIYCLYHDPSSMPAEISNAFSHHLPAQSSNERTHQRTQSRSKGKKTIVPVSASHVTKKRRCTISLSTDEDSRDASADCPPEKRTKKRPTNGRLTTARKRDE